MGWERRIVRESGKTEGGRGGLKGLEMTEEAGLHGRGLNSGGDYCTLLGPHKPFTFFIL